MFFDTVEDLHYKFKLFDRMNTLVFGIWKDKSALEYRDGALQDLRILYMNYINEMRQQCNELTLLDKEIDSALRDVQKSATKIDFIFHIPSIQGCCIVSATGYKNCEIDEAGEAHFSDHTNEECVGRCSDISNYDSYAARRLGLYECKASLSQTL